MVNSFSFTVKKLEKLKYYSHSKEILKISNVFKIKIVRRRFYTQVISRILYLDMNLSGIPITRNLKRKSSAEAEPIYLHHLGFTKTFILLWGLSARKNC